MEDKFKLNTSCAYCEKEMDAKYRSKKFCSPKCRVYFGREKQLKEVLSKGYDKDLLDKVEKNENANIQMELAKYKAEYKGGASGRRIDIDELKNIANRHPLWKEGDPKENSAAFVLRYGCSNYSELENLKK